MENEFSKKIITFGRCEIVSSIVSLLMCLVLILADSLFKVGGGFLAVLGLWFGLLSLLGLISGVFTLRFKKSGRTLNLVLALIFIWDGLPKIIYGFITFIKGQVVYPLWRVGISMLLLIVSLFIIYFFTRPKIKEQFK